jgi:hypothetical protein
LWRRFGGGRTVWAAPEAVGAERVGCCETCFRFLDEECCWSDDGTAAVVVVRKDGREQGGGSDYGEGGDTHDWQCILTVHA